jgi:hypothetical protein
MASAALRAPRVTTVIHGGNSDTTDYLYTL